MYIGICRSSTFILFYLALFGLDFAPFNLRQIKNPSSPDPILIQSISQVFLGPLELKTAIVATASNGFSNYPSSGIGSIDAQWRIPRSICSYKNSFKDFSGKFFGIKTLISSGSPQESLQEFLQHSF